MKKIKAVMLVAGKSTRTFPLTQSRPKALLDVAGKKIIEHNIDQIIDFVDEIVFVVGYKKEIIVEFLEKKYGSINGLKLTFVEQKKQLGTGDAVKCAKKSLDLLSKEEHFLLLMGDDLIFKKDVLDGVKLAPSIAVHEVDEPSRYGICSIKENPDNPKSDILEHIDEKPKNPKSNSKSNLANMGLYVLSRAIFDIIDELKLSPRGEYELTDALNIYAKNQKVSVIRAKKWIPITFPWHILDANEHLMCNLYSVNHGTVEKGATLKGNVNVGKGTVIKSGSYIEGPVYIGENCTIGPNCFIRANTVIGNGCKVGNAVEVKNSSLYENVSVGHLSYIGDSVIGSDVNLGAGTITANLKHDNGNVKSVVKGELVDSNRRKLGTIIGDNVHTGIHTSIYPGRKIFSSKNTVPGEIIKKDIE